jgi:prepilin-type N-terminal cleavage/methylation domain-containing protein
VPGCRRGRPPSDQSPPHLTLPREKPITRHPIRAAFTLTELLAVIAVIAVMFALLRPAARAANEATPETQCTDDLDPITKERHDHRATAAGQPFPDGRDPRPLLAEINAAYRAGDVSDLLETRTTKVGRRVMAWLVEQKWFDERPALVITEKKSQGDRQELVGVYKFADGTEKVALVFFWEGGTLKFHDVCCFDLKGHRANMFL